MVMLTYLYIIILSFWQLNLSWKQTFNCFCGKFGTEVSRAAFGWWVVSYFGLLTCSSNDIIWCIVFCLLVELAVFKTRKCTTCYLEKKNIRRKGYGLCCDYGLNMFLYSTFKIYKDWLRLMGNHRKMNTAFIWDEDSKATNITILQTGFPLYDKWGMRAEVIRVSFLLFEENKRLPSVIIMIFSLKLVITCGGSVSLEDSQFKEPTRAL